VSLAAVDIFSFNVGGRPLNKQNSVDYKPPSRKISFWNVERNTHREGYSDGKQLILSDTVLSNMSYIIDM